MNYLKTDLKRGCIVGVWNKLKKVEGGVGFFGGREGHWNLCKRILVCGVYRQGNRILIFLC